MKITYDPEVSGSDHVVLEGKAIIGGLCSIPLITAKRLRIELTLAINKAVDVERKAMVTRVRNR